MATWTIASTFEIQVGTVTTTDITVSYLAGADFTNDGSVDAYLNSVRLNLTPTGTPTQGTFNWNADEETADLVLNGAVLQLGQEVHYHVRNNSGAQINDGRAVMATGTIGASGRITIGLMDGSDIANAKYFLGIATEDIANGDDGKISFFGKTRGLDTSMWNEGDVLWVDNAVLGGLTNVMPTSGTKLPIAFVITKHATQGTIAVRSTDGTYFEEAHDVDLSAKADGYYIYYDNTSSSWKTKGLFYVEEIACSDETSDLSTGDVATFRIATAMTVTDVRASVTTAPVGSTIIINVLKNAVTILSTNITIDAGEETSTTAAIPPVISVSSIADDDEIVVNVVQVGSATAGAGLKVKLIGTI